MLFVLEKESKVSFENDIELLIVQKLLRENKTLHKFVFHKLNDFYHIVELNNKYKLRKNLLPKYNFPKEYEHAIPIGSIPFVESFLKLFYGFNMEYAIEVPTILRTDEFLKRKYSIVPYNEIPRSGNYFIKDATALKVFSYCGDISAIFNKNASELNRKYIPELDETHLYQVSEVVNVLSEYRVYVIGGKIAAIEFYNGDPCLFPDVALINKANIMYSTQNDYPCSYSMDVMITEKGTSIVEIHNFTSLGLYSTVWGSNLLQAYVDGINYLLKHNTPPTTFSNF